MSDNILQVPVYLDVDKIVESYRPQSGIIPLDDDFYQIPIMTKSKIEVGGCSQIQFTLTNKEGIAGTMFWLSYFQSESGDEIVKPGANRIDGTNNNPTNVMTLDVIPNKTSHTEDQTFHLHCYFIIYNEEAKHNVVYHCSIDPQLQAKQSG